MNESIQKLIEKRENTLMNYTINSLGGMVITEILQDLQALKESQSTTEEGLLEEIKDRILKEKRVGIPYKNGLARAVEIIDEYIFTSNQTT